MSSSEIKFRFTSNFKCSAKDLFDAWTIAENLKQWWGPSGFDVPVYTIDLNPDGLIHYCLKTPEGMEMWGRSRFIEITPHERLIFVNSFSNKNGEISRNPFNPFWPLELETHLTFKEDKDGSKMNFESFPINASEPQHKNFEVGIPSMEMGWNGTLNRLKEYVESLNK